MFTCDKVSMYMLYIYELVLFTIQGVTDIAIILSKLNACFFAGCRIKHDEPVLKDLNEYHKVNSGNANGVQ